jgi:hypothetical protein
MTTFTVEIQARNADGTIWQAMEPAETIDTSGWGTDWTAEEVARTTVDHQTIAEKPYRVAVWAGTNADTSTEPSFILDVEAKPESLLEDIRSAARRAEQSIAERNELILVAMARTDISRTALAAAAGIKEARLYQIRDGRR